MRCGVSRCVRRNRTRQFWRAVPYYIRNEDELVPSADRFNAGQKLLFWGFFWCGILLLLSGLILWFTEFAPWNLRCLRYFAVIIHPSAALLYNRPVHHSRIHGHGYGTRHFGSVIRGDVSVGWAKKYHRVWYEHLPWNSAARKMKNGKWDARIRRAMN